MKTQVQPKCVTRHWVGIDVSKKTFDAAVLLKGELGSDPPLGSLPAKAFARSIEGVKEFLAWLDAQCIEVEGEVRCVMETTGRYSTELVVLLIAQRPHLAPAIVHAQRTADYIKSLGIRNQTDKLAARGLALFGLHRQPDAYTPLSAQERELRDVCRYRQSLVETRTALKNQHSELGESRFVAKNRAKRLRLLEGDIKRAEEQMRKIVRRAPLLELEIDLLDTIYGVGFITATVVRAELGDLNRFGRARELTAHAGLNPNKRESGTSVRHKTRMSKQGNHRVRQALYMASMVAIKGDNDFAESYHRYVRSGMEGAAALGIIMRKLLVLMRAIIISKKPFDPHHQRCGKRSAKTGNPQPALCTSP